MVEPSASNGQARKLSTLLAAVTAATESEPSELTATCRITLPIAVMEYCKPHRHAVCAQFRSCAWIAAAIPTG